MADKIIMYFNMYPTVRYASIALILISVCAALLGVCLVLKRYSMIGDGLSHVSFGTSAIATVLGLTTPLYITMPITVLAAILLLKIRVGSGIKGDSAIAMISSACLAFGYIILNLFSSDDGASSDACATLFGSGILSIGLNDVIVCSILASAVLFIFIFYYNKLFAVTFDEDFATATGTHANAYNTLLAIVTGITIVIAINMTGALLVSALIIFPALSAMRLFKSFKKVTVCAVIISLFCALLGTLTSLLLATAIGPTIVTANLIIFVICYIIGLIKNK